MDLLSKIKLPRLNRRTIAMIVAAALVVGVGVTAAVLLLRGPSPEQIASAEAVWGLSPDPHQPVDYQPDVKLLDHGAVAIVGVLEDGVTWRLDGGYPGVDSIEVGSVLFLTNRVVGRVAMITDADGGDVDVVLIPVDLPALVQNLDMTFSESISDGELTVGEAVAYPGQYYEPPSATESDPDAPSTDEEIDPAVSPGGGGGSGVGGGGSVGAILAPQSMGQAASLPAARAGVVSELLPSRVYADGWGTGPVEFSAGPWSIELSASPTELGFKAARTSEVGGSSAWGAPSGLKLGVDLALSYNDLMLEGGAQIVNGGWAGKPTMVLTGLNGVRLGFWGGAANGLSDNAKFRIEVPFDIGKSIVVGGIPLYLQVKLKFYVATGFSAKNATLAANAIYSLSGELGMREGNPVAPTMTVVQPLIDSISGISLGIDSAVFATEARFYVGVGVEAVTAGPYVKIVGSASLLRGSQLTAPWGVPCQATHVWRAGGGLGGQVVVPFAETLKRVLGKEVKIEIEAAERLVDLIPAETATQNNCVSVSPASSTPGETPPVDPQQSDNNPYTAAGAPNVPGPGNVAPPRPEEPVTEAVENPTSPNSAIQPDGTSTGPVPGPQPIPGYYTVYDEEYCELEPDPEDPEAYFGVPTRFRCKDLTEPERERETTP